MFVTRKVLRSSKNKRETMYQNHSSSGFNSLNSNSGFKLKSFRISISFDPFYTYLVSVNNNLFKVYHTAYSMQPCFLKTFSSTDLHAYSMINKKARNRERRA